MTCSVKHPIASQPLSVHLPRRFIQTPLLKPHHNVPFLSDLLLLIRRPLRLPRPRQHPNHDNPPTFRLPLSRPWPSPLRCLPPPPTCYQKQRLCNVIPALHVLRLPPSLSCIPCRKRVLHTSDCGV